MSSFERYLPLTVSVACLLLWEGLARSGLISVIFFPPPTRILESLYAAIVKDSLLYHTSRTMLRMFIGVSLGGGLGLLLGMLMGWSGRLRHFVDPFVAAVHPIPKIAIMPLIMVIFGIGETSKILLIALASFFPLLINSIAGVRQIQSVYFDVAQNFNCDRWHTFSHIIFPGSLPLILSGARLSLNVAFLITIAVELVSANDGLGAYIWLAWETLRIVEIYVALIIISILGVLMNWFLQIFRRRIVV